MAFPSSSVCWIQPHQHASWEPTWWIKIASIVEWFTWGKLVDATNQILVLVFKHLLFLKRVVLSKSVCFLTLHQFCQIRHLFPPPLEVLQQAEVIFITWPLGHVSCCWWLPFWKPLLLLCAMVSSGFSSPSSDHFSSAFLNGFSFFAPSYLCPHDSGHSPLLHTVLANSPMPTASSHSIHYCLT